MTLLDTTHTAIEGMEGSRLVSFAAEDSNEQSFLAFQLDANGVPEICIECHSIRDKFALLAFAEEAIARLKREAFNSTQLSARVSCAA